MPMAIAITVSSSVATRPLRMPCSKKYFPNVLQSRFGLVNSMWTSMAARTSTIAPLTHLPGCRTGTALMVSGRTGSAVSVSVTASSASRSVDLGVGDGATFDTPLVGQHLVSAVGDQVLDGLLDRVPQLVLVLGDRDAVRRGVIGVARDDELAARFLGRV